MPPTTTNKDRTASENSRASPSTNAGNKPGPTTRTDTRRNGGLVLEDQQDINDATEGRKFLEKHSLLCPPGEPPSHTSLSTCLHQVSAMAGVQKPVLNALRAIAFLLEEMEETHINVTVKEAFDSQITEFTSDMKLLIEDAKEKIDTHIKSSEDRMSEIINEAISQVASQPKQAQANTYASVLSAQHPPPHANPKIAAREGIKARIFLLEGLNNSKFSHFDSFQLKTELNKVLSDTGLNNEKIRSINKLRNGGTLVEMDSDEATVWFADAENRSNFCQKLGPGVLSRTRCFNVIVFNSPLNIDPDDSSHRQEVNEANNLEKDTIAAMRWAKPIARRSPAQRTAHLIITMTNADAANRAITSGLYICNRRCYVERVKREPTRCLKCQGWNHYAKDCLEKENRCGNCASNHRTSDCPTPQARHCVSCKSNDHASWSRECPTFNRKLEELNARNPENTLQYIPTADPWTWTTNDKRLPPPPPSAPPVRTDNYRERSQPPRRHQPPPRKVDSYVPNYGRQQAQGYGYNNSAMDWEDNAGPSGLQEFRPFNQNTVNEINKEAMNRAANTNPSS